LEVSKAVYLKQDIGRILGNIVEDEKYKAVRTPLRAC
jgi:hypothetical protein